MQAILNSIPEVSAMNPISAYLPLLFVLSISMLREGLEDYQRYKQDKMTNKQPVKIVKDGGIVECESKDISVGDILLIHEDEFFPADLILLTTSKENATCLVKTSSLDGEAAPKMKKVAKGLDWFIPSGGKRFSPDEFVCTGRVEAEGPHSNLYTFTGKLEIAKRIHNLTYDQMILKGTQLMNTEWILAMAVYTGNETRILLNSQVSRLKQSDTEKMMNKFTVYVVVTLIVLTLILSIIGGYWHSEASATADQLNEQSSHFYIEFGQNSLTEGFFTFVRYF